MKLKDMIVSAVIKQGILYEGRDVEIPIEIPVESEGKEKIIKIQLKAAHMTLRLDKD